MGEEMDSTPAESALWWAANCSSSLATHSTSLWAAAGGAELATGGGGGPPPPPGGGGGGGSFVFRGDGYLNGGLLFAAAGGSGIEFGTSIGFPGIGSGGHPAGPASYGGFAGGGVAINGNPGPVPPQQPAQPGSFPYGGAGACCYFGGGPSGGFGGGGGGGYYGGGGGGGASGVGGYGGGYSYVIKAARKAFGITGGNMSGYTRNGFGANGYVSINFAGSAPEPSTWAMTLTGFAGLGWLARLRRRKLTPV
jgi:hypothetical protein